MRRTVFVPIVSLTLLLFVGGTAQATNGNQLPPHKDKAVCTMAGGPNAAACAARVVTQVDGVTPLATTSYQNGYAPADLRSAYNLGSASSTATVAIVDAYDNPNAESDLAAYRSQFGLSSCTSGTGCFRKVNQNGGSAMPRGDTGWGQEIDLDIEMVSAICPSCHVLLVEADSNSIADLGTAVNRAASMGAVAISNSYGTSGEFNGETSYDGYYDHQHIAVTASSGDSGYGVAFPAASNHVVAVGGTSLTGSPGSWAETAWSGAGSGCSSFYTQPSWQATANTGCSNRAEADVSAVADPSTGVAVYDSYGSTNGNWYVFGGTSVSSPIIASVFALAGNTGSLTYPASYLYTHTGGLNDVTSGSNGRCTKGGWKHSFGATQLCTAGPGWDGPTGLGTPNGTSAF